MPYIDHMKQLETNFRDGGFNYEIVQRAGDVVLAKVFGEFEGKVTGFVVFHVRKFADRSIMGNFSAAHESVPPSEAWGDEAWTYSGSDDLVYLFNLAVKRFNAEFTRQPYSEVIDNAPTGQPRGRARNTFELDLTPFGNNTFLFLDLATHYSDIDAIMLRNRLNEQVKDNKVKVVGVVEREGKGKRPNIYQVVV